MYLELKAHAEVLRGRQAGISHGGFTGFLPVLEISLWKWLEDGLEKKKESRGKALLQGFEQWN